MQLLIKRVENFSRIFSVVYMIKAKLVNYYWRLFVSCKIWVLPSLDMRCDHIVMCIHYQGMEREDKENIKFIRSGRCIACLHRYCNRIVFSWIMRERSLTIFDISYTSKYLRKEIFHWIFSVGDLYIPHFYQKNDNETNRISGLKNLTGLVFLLLILLESSFCL